MADSEAVQRLARTFSKTPAEVEAALAEHDGDVEAVAQSFLNYVSLDELSAMLKATEDQYAQEMALRDAAAADAAGGGVPVVVEGGAASSSSSKSVYAKTPLTASASSETSSEAGTPKRRRGLARGTAVTLSLKQLLEVEQLQRLHPAAGGGRPRSSSDASDGSRGGAAGEDADGAGGAFGTMPSRTSGPSSRPGLADLTSSAPVDSLTPPPPPTAGGAAAAAPAGPLYASHVIVERSRGRGLAVTSGSLAAAVAAWLRKNCPDPARVVSVSTAFRGEDMVGTIIFLTE